jgi:starch synthase (maltosyl-transferring)
MYMRNVCTKAMVLALTLLGLATLANRALESLIGRFWLHDRGWFADQLSAADGRPADAAAIDDALRPNQLFLVSLGIVRGDLARRAVAACERHLAIPGALRSLADLPQTLPLEVPGVDPLRPYRGCYSGDEDTSRKPAYHNGTAWLWLWPTFCEALALAWDREPGAVAAATSYLSALDGWLDTGCAGHLPEIADGDAPHRPRGCDAQAWSVTEALRVSRLLSRWSA